MHQMKILTESVISNFFEIKGHFAKKKTIQYFLSCPRLSTLQVWEKPNFRREPLCEIKKLSDFYS